MSASAQNPQAAFEQSVKALGEWLAFLKTRESEYLAQLERAKKASSSEAEVPVVQLEDEGTGSGMDVLLPPGGVEAHEGWL